MSELEEEKEIVAPGKISIKKYVDNLQINNHNLQEALRNSNNIVAEYFIELTENAKKITALEAEILILRTGYRPK